MKTIRDMFDEKINQNNIKNNVMNRVNSSHHVNYKISFACFLIILGMSLLFTFHLKKEPNSITLSNCNQTNIVRWNYPGIENIALFEVNWVSKNKTVDEFAIDYPWIQNMIIPKTYTLDKSEMMYGLSEAHQYFGNNVMYRKEDSLIVIYFSRVQKQMPRCLNLYEIENLEDSNIGGVSMKLIAHEFSGSNEYVALFQKDGVYFDITIYNGNQADFITLLESIVHECG